MARPVFFALLLGLVTLCLASRFGPRTAMAAPSGSVQNVDCTGPDSSPASVFFAWGLTDPKAVVWIDLTTQDRDFSPGTFVSAGPFGGDTRMFRWEGIARNVQHTWRLRDDNQ